MLEEVYQREFKTLKEDFNDLKLYLDEIRNVLPISVCTLSSFWVIVDINKTTENLTGYSSLEIIGQPVNFIFREKEKLEELKEKVGAGKKILVQELRLATKDGKEIPVSASIIGRRGPEKNLIGYFLTITDVAKIKEYQQQLEKRTKELEGSRAALMNILEDVEEARNKAEEEKDKTQTIITNFTDGLLVFDSKGKLSLVNPQFESFFQIKSGEIIDKSILELSDFPSLKPLVDLLKREIKGIFRKEILINQEITLEVSTINIVSKENSPGTLVVLHDITREKMIEKIKTEFVSLAAHQLRTPLSGIKWTLRMLLDGDLGQITEEQRDFIEKTYQNNERMIGLINDLLDITRIEEGRYLYKPVLTNLEDLVQFVINSGKEEIGKKNLKLVFEKPKVQLPKVEIDVEKMRLVIQNFLDNAMKYTPPAGEITIALEHLEEQREIKFSIKDTGVGIPEDQKSRVFSKFFRGANVIRMATEGSGLGLFICKNIIEAHGGRIWFESKENEGTTFYFTLPVGREFEEFLKEF